MTTAQWIIIAVICGTIEIFTLGLWFLWFALAALLVAIGVRVEWFNSVEVQLLIFALVSIILIILTRPLAVKLFKTKDTTSNVKALIGQHGIAMSRITPLSFGQVKVNGEIWSAISDQPIEANTRIEVTGIDGVKLLVKTAVPEFKSS
ncbi:Voltage-dependent channel, four helix bundle domain [Syntrophomonas zehnderi OL-4]|uniref:Voltage-dependent channel, four helix bundle domain n=1 Tax=Syntrophomonas zehnderi OL-4 TaxID=690567 RepID=A0A0E4C9A4_9FIRM|nr:NfeD family protein [Syntrophomonas zehnderi]CFX90560.1 Voltage-dependent channel, four helix bundle domain [Syntrophomonas zehnderi OL-4]